MKRFTLLCLVLLIPLILVISGCAQIAPVVQADIGKLQADLQAKKAALVPQLQAGIAYATQAGDVEWANCQSGILTLMNSPTQTLPDIGNPFINVEIIHQGSQAIQAGVGQSKLVQSINVACAAWYVREKAEIMAIAAKIALMVK